MAIPITRADLDRRVGAAEVTKFAKADGAPAIDEAIAQAWDSARSAALNVFTAESWDELTEGTLPPEAKKHIVSDAIDILSSGNNRPELIDKKAEEAKLWRSWLAADKVRSFDAVLERTGVSEDGVSYQLPERKFDRRKNDYYGVPRRT